MVDLVTYGIELAVGVASLALAVPAWRRGGWFRGVGVALTVAGLAAVVHALSQLVM
jgi:hypothetical protein